MRYYRACALLLAVALVLSACTLGPGSATPQSIPANDTTASTSNTSVPASDTTAPPSDTAAPAGDAGRVTITFGAWEYERPTYEPLIAAFEKDNPNIHVQIVNLESVVKSISTGGGTISDDASSLRDIVSAADTVAMDPTPEAITRGWVRDLTPLMDADASFNRDDFYPSALAAVSLPTGSYMLPHTMFIPLLSYNKALWTAHGLPAPKPGWSWDDVLAAAEQLTQKQGDTVNVYGLMASGIRSQLLRQELTKAGVTLTGTLNLQDPAFVQAVQRMVDLEKSGVVYNTYYDPQKTRTMIFNQQVGIWSSDLLGDTSGVPFEIGTTTGVPNRVGLVAGFLMSAGAQHPQEAWRWLNFLTHQNLQQLFGMDDVGTVPARKSLAESSDYSKQLDPETSAAITAVLAQPASPPPPSFGPRVDLLIDQTLTAIIEEGKPVRDALRAAQTTLDQLAAQDASQPTPSTGQVVVATPVPEAPPGATTITFGAPEFFADALRKLARSFNQQHPDIFVQVKSLGQTGGGVQLNDVNSTGDCFTRFGPLPADQLAAFLDLQPLLDADASFKISDYPNALLTPFTSGSGLYGLPYAVGFRTLNYNQDAFDAANLSHPSGDWTLDDFMNAAQQLTSASDANKHYGFASLGPPIQAAQDVFFFLDQSGTSAATGSGATLRPNFTDPKVLQAIQTYMELLRSDSPHKQLPGYIPGDDSGNAVQLITNGQVGMWFDYGASFFNFGSEDYTAFRRAIAPPPINGGTVSDNDFAMRGMYISAKTQQIDACWSWLKYLSEDVSGLGGGFPARRSVAASDAFTKQAPTGSVDVYNAYIAAFERNPSAVSPPESAAQPQIDYFWFLRAVDRALQGKDLERELSDAQTVTEQYLDCVQGGEVASTCAPQVDATYQKR